MNEWSLLQILAYGVAAVVGLYIAARVISAAWFFSRQQYEERMNRHEP